ncbi:MAG: FprA family A-type flavoprotein [Bacteroidaceae bacterium]|nr:FprA family A-type flavoprotein [Bacteroidaceae bacterium]
MNISNTIRYIGVDDLDIDLFESQYHVPEGMSYNSYLILDEKTAVMDTVDRRKSKEWKEKLVEALRGRAVDYLVVHHMEPDHAADIADMARSYPDMKIVLSAAARKMLPNFFPDTDLTERLLVVKEGDTLSLGQHTLQFIAAPMVHWPEVLMSYEQSEKVLFAADGFGKFGAICNEKRHADGTPSDWACEARRYYFNIVGKYGIQVQNVLKKVAKLDIRTIAPLHGPVLTGDLTPYLSLYDTWSKYEPETEGVFVAYASIHGGTRAVAEKMVEILKAKGCPKVAISDLSRDDMAEAIEDAFRYPTLVLLAASYDANVFPPMHDFLWHLQIKGFQRRRFGLVENGSWAPTAGKVMTEMIGQMKDCQIVGPLVTIYSRMKPTDLPQLEALADAVLSKEE